MVSEGGDDLGRGLGLDDPEVARAPPGPQSPRPDPYVPARTVPVEAPAMTDKGVLMNRTRRTATLALVLGGTLFASGCGGGGGFEDGSASKPPASAKGPAALKMLIASSGDAETAAVKAAADAWAKKTGEIGRASCRERV